MARDDVEKAIRNTLGLNRSKRSALGPDAALKDVLASEIQRSGVEATLASLDSELERIGSELDHVSIAVTGLGWLGSGIPSVLSAILELISSAEHEILLTAYSITAGSQEVLSALSTSLEAGIEVSLVINRLADQAPETQLLLRQLSGHHPRLLSVYDFTSGQASANVHAKILAVDRRSALIGSANLTHYGMVTGHELAVILRGPSAATIAQRVDALLDSGLVRRAF